MLTLNEPDLLINAALIGGEWVHDISTGKTFDVVNPSTGETIATLPDLGQFETNVAIDAANRAQKNGPREPVRFVARSYGACMILSSPTVMT